MSTAGFALKDSQSCQGSLGAFQEFLDLGPMELGRDSTDPEASDQMGQMDKAGSQVCLEWAQEVQALVIKITSYCADPTWLPVSEHTQRVCLCAGPLL